MADETIKNLKEEPDLYKRSIKGGYWVFAIRFATQILGFVKSIFIVNYFLLNDLGIISAAIMMMEILSTFTQTGFETALIQKKEDIRDYLDTAWTAGVIKGIALFGVLYFAAPLLASFGIPAEKAPLAIWVFRAMGVCFLMSGFRNIGAVYFSKNMDFHKTFSLSVTSTLTDIVLSIGLVLVFRSIWGVIAARLISAAVSCAGTYFLSPYRPKLHFAPSKARELWEFGRWIYTGNIVGFLISQGDDFFVWFYLGIQPLALYRTAYNFATTPATHISYVISEVSFPAYSKIQNDLPRLREAYLKVLKLTAFLAVPVSFLIFLLGPDFVHLFLPERMYPMTIALQILAVKGFMASISSTYGPVFNSLGKPHVILYTSILCLIILAVTIYPFTKLWGIAGTALSTVLFGILVNPLCFILMCRQLRCSVWKILREILVPVGASIIMTVVLAACRIFCPEEPTFIWFFVLGIISLMVYLAVMGLMDHVFNYGMKPLFLDQFHFLKQKMGRMSKQTPA